MTGHMTKITVSAPGKLMLLGEHAVVYNRPCLVTAVDQRMKASLELLEEPIFKLEAPDVKVSGYQKPMSELGFGEIPKGASFVEIAVRNFFIKYPQIQGLSIPTKSEFSSLFGFGSSSASTVCVIYALSKLLNINLGQKEIFDLAYKTVLDIQGKGSGFDVAAAVFGGTLYFVTGGKEIEPLKLDNLPLAVGYSGIKADTVTLINLVKQKMETHKEGVKKIYDSIEGLVKEGKKALVEKDWERLGTLMNFNQDYLEDLGVSTEKLNLMIEASRKMGAYGAKLSGAGGGDCMIALVSEQKREEVEKGIKSVGGEVININTNAEGVRVENI